MKLHKAILLTLLYSFSLELIGFWILLIPIEMESIRLIKASYFINSLISLILLLVLFKSIKQSDFLELKKNST